MVLCGVGLCVVAFWLVVCVFVSVDYVCVFVCDVLYEVVLFVLSSFLCVAAVCALFCVTCVFCV